LYPELELLQEKRGAGEGGAVESPDRQAAYNAPYGLICRCAGPTEAAAQELQ